MKPPETIRTARLVLRKPTREDAPLMFAAYGQDHEVAHYVTWRPHTCVSDSEAVIGRFLDLWRDGSGFHWLLFQYGGSELMGVIGLRGGAHRLELGYVLARRFWGHGFMAEAVTAVVDCAFTEPSVFRVGALCDIDNPLGAPAGKSWLRAGGRFTLVGGSPKHFSDAPRLLLLFQNPQHLTMRCSEVRKAFGVADLMSR